MKAINKPMENLVNVNRRVKDFYKELVLDKPQEISILHDTECDTDSKQLYYQSITNRIYGSSYLNGKLPAASMYGQIGTIFENPSMKKIIYDCGFNGYNHKDDLIWRIEMTYGSIDNLTLDILPLFSESAAMEWRGCQQRFLRINAKYSSLLPYSTFVSLALKDPDLRFKLSPEHLRVINVFVGEKTKLYIERRKWSSVFAITELELIEKLNSHTSIPYIMTM